MAQGRNGSGQNRGLSVCNKPKTPPPHPSRTPSLTHSTSQEDSTDAPSCLQLCYTPGWFTKERVQNLRRKRHKRLKGAKRHSGQSRKIPRAKGIPRELVIWLRQRRQKREEAVSRRSEGHGTAASPWSRACWEEGCLHKALSVYMVCARQPQFTTSLPQSAEAKSKVLHIPCCMCLPYLLIS